MHTCTQTCSCHHTHKNETKLLFTITDTTPKQGGRGREREDTALLSTLAHPVTAAVVNVVALVKKDTTRPKCQLVYTYQSNFSPRQQQTLPIYAPSQSLSEIGLL